jgi:hypothetical protein
VARFGIDRVFSFAFSSYLITDVSQPQCTRYVAPRSFFPVGAK